MSDPLQETLRWVRDLMRFVAEQLAAFGTRLATWLIVGNAGALVLAFNAMLSGQVCDNDLLKRVTGLFALGLLSAFGAAAISYFIGMFAAHAMNKSVNGLALLSANEFYIEQLEGQGIEVPEGAPLRQGIAAATKDTEVAKKCLPWIWGGMGLVFLIFAVSAVSFASGVLVPVFSDGGFGGCGVSPQARMSLPAE